MPLLSMGFVSMLPNSPCLDPSMVDREESLTTQSIGEVSQKNSFYLLLSITLEYKWGEILNSETKQNRKNTAGI